ncbi:pyridoxal 5'-phosphate synthase glutaminase subunit PdxT [Streptomyces sulphureus]|uniref:pyridoxal 5'-phosphate synthase glutaminase subunit PdxT n=1 Tax=Streptomyces sulphureus TaxID=47758 RepID=UPI0003702299|nr:pyridoxal 5'-phosphate synthase glutaminase subunit PdxT [Streptomyces sulphureus]
MEAGGDRPPIGVLALQGDVREHLAALAACGAEARTVRTAAELADVEGLVVPGGESTTIAGLAGSFGLLEPLRARIAAGMPAYGSCAGMVLLAEKVLAPDGHEVGQQTFGGIGMAVRRNAFGRQNESFEAEIEVAGVDGGPVTGVFIRAPWVESTGERTVVLAEYRGHPVAVTQGNLLATSFHPELTGDPRVHALFVGLVRRAVLREEPALPWGYGPPGGRHAEWRTVGSPR